MEEKRRGVRVEGCAGVEREGGEHGPSGECGRSITTRSKNLVQLEAKGMG